MAMADWLIVSPKSGTGSGTTSVGAQVFTGRVKRASELTYSATGITETFVIPVEQTPKAEFVSGVDFINGTTLDVDAGSTLIIYVNSNSSNLKVSVDTGDFGDDNLNYTPLFKSFGTPGEQVEIPAATGIVPDDPGASAQYIAGFQLTARANEGVENRMAEVTFTIDNGDTIKANVRQLGASPTFSVNVTSVEIPADGTAQIINVSTNTTYTVS